ncbi:YraN family protein [Oceanomicrobium pacificus]|uniref:UPF0102 protein GSH16_03370 n=1 Tax=Oceanomicrobium pacificus TaxID=2692916 RepID=A0A6B0TRN3_9RHOB|nr:YraN family protein [Oceanomicrobium pacificus]MXU64475.1 hypothetical protein [Oceanomicrobium pacificus]
MTGTGAHLTGEAAERATCAAYEAEGYRREAARWHGGGGEIDLIVSRGPLLVFVEVKARRSLRKAANALTAAQKRRILRAAQAYLTQRDADPDEIRFDLVAVDPSGRCARIKAAFDAGELGLDS